MLEIDSQTQREREYESEATAERTGNYRRANLPASLYPKLNFLTRPGSASSLAPLCTFLIRSPHLLEVASSPLVSPDRAIRGQACGQLEIMAVSCSDQLGSAGLVENCGCSSDSWLGEGSKDEAACHHRPPVMSFIPSENLPEGHPGFPFLPPLLQPRNPCWDAQANG